jgi:serine/threonine protein kinase
MDIPEAPSILSDQLRLGLQLGQSGSYGAVYEADYVGPPRRKVAVKVLPRSCALCQTPLFMVFPRRCRIPQVFHMLRDPELYGIQVGDQQYLKAVEEVKQEGMMLATLRNDFVLGFVGLRVGQDGRPDGLVTELASSSLLGYLESLHEPLTMRTLLRLSRQVLAGLIYLHRGPKAAVVHRDLNPKNVLVFIETNGDVTAKIGDVGLARFASNLLVTKAGTVFYMAPEILGTTKSYTTKVDMFSFGMMLAEIVVRFMTARVVPADQRLSYVHAACDELASTCPALGSLILKCVKELPHQRPCAVQAFFDLQADSCLAIEPYVPHVDTNLVCRCQLTAVNTRRISYPLCVRGEISRKPTACGSAGSSLCRRQDHVFAPVLQAPLRGSLWCLVFQVFLIVLPCMLERL